MRLSSRTLQLAQCLLLSTGLLSSCATEDEFGWKSPVNDSFTDRVHRYRMENEAKNDAWFDRIMHHPVGNTGIATGNPD